MKRTIFLVLLVSFFGVAWAQMSEPQPAARFPMALDANFYGVDIPEAALYFREFTSNSGNGPGGFMRDYFFSGVLQAEGGTRESSLTGSPENHSKEGVYFWYHENGNILSIAFFSNSKAEGAYSLFYEDGSLKEEGNYSNGLLNGICQSFYENGNKKSISNYENGLLKNKTMEEFSEDGTKSVVYFENFPTSANIYNWVTGDFSDYSGNIEAKVGVKLTNKDYNRMAYHFKKPDVLTGTPYNYACLISSVSGNTGSYYGISFDFNDWNNYKYFVISDKGYWAVGQYTGGTNSYLIAPSYSGEIKKAQSFGGFMYDNQNMLEILNENGKTRFMVNGNLLDASLPIFSGYGQFGLYIESGVKTVTFNQFYIKSK